MQENRFYVYVHICKESGEVRYIGKGTEGRYKHKSNRTKAHKESWESLDKRILINNLTQPVAKDIEHRLIVDAIKYGKKLFNVVKSRSDVRKIDYTVFANIFEYSEESPSGLIAKISRNGGVIAGKPVGCLIAPSRTGGYWRVKYNGKGYSAHRIIYALCHQVELDEDMVIDHIDSNRGNNKIENLQQITRSQNNRKALPTKRNTSGEKGVSWHKGSKTWVAYWNAGRKLYSKSFCPHVRYPELDYDSAKELAFKDAVKFRADMVALHYT